MKISSTALLSLSAIGAGLAVASSAQAAGFVNGGFEAGNTSGWTSTTSVYRGSVLNSSLTPTWILGRPDAGDRSAIVTTSYVDPNVGAALGSAVYSGNNAFRVEDTVSGGYASMIQQRVDNYTDANIFFAWKSVLEGAHGRTDAATMIITLTDLTSGLELIRREYNAASSGGGVDSRFSFVNNHFYTPNWQIEQLAIDSSLSGHNFLLSVIAADCQPTGHEGYVFLDGFGAVTPPPIDPGTSVPEPSTWAMMLAGFGLLGASMRRKQTARVRFAF